MFGIGVCCCAEVPPLPSCCAPLAQQFENEYRSWSFRLEVSGAISPPPNQLITDPCYLKIEPCAANLNGTYDCEWLTDTGGVGLDGADCFTRVSWYRTPTTQRKECPGVENGVPVTYYNNMWALIKLYWGSRALDDNPAIHRIIEARVYNSPFPDFFDLGYSPQFALVRSGCCDADEVTCGTPVYFYWPDCQPARFNITWNH